MTDIEQDRIKADIKKQIDRVVADWQAKQGDTPKQSLPPYADEEEQEDFKWRIMNRMLL